MQIYSAVQAPSVLSPATSKNRAYNGVLITTISVLELVCNDRTTVKLQNVVKQKDVYKGFIFRETAASVSLIRALVRGGGLMCLLNLK